MRIHTVTVDSTVARAVHQILYMGSHRWYHTSWAREMNPVHAHTQQAASCGMKYMHAQHALEIDAIS